MSTDPSLTQPPLDEAEAEAAAERAAAQAQRGTLGRTAARGALITVGGQGVKILLQVVGVVVLARLLTPGDYGLVAMVTAIIGVAEIFRDFGLSSAAVQAKTLSRAQRDNLFWINTGAGLAFTVLVFFTAPLVAAVYGHEELVGLTHVLAFVFVLNGMGTQYRADLNRRLRFTTLAVVDVAAPAISLVVAIVAAVQGAGYWALAVQQLTMAVVLLVGNAVTARWIPRLPRRAPMRDLFRFGWQLAGSLFVGYLGNNIDSLTIGTRFGSEALGLYNRAFQLLMTPLGQLRAPTTKVALPVLSRLRDDRAASNAYIQRGQSALGLTLVAGLGVVIGAAGPITSIFLGRQWLSVEPILRLLAVAGVFQSLAYVGLWIYLSHGLTKELLQYTMITVTIKIACILVGSTWGVTGVAWGYALAPALAWPLSFWWLSRKAPVDVGPLFVGAGRILVLTAFLAAGAFGACELTAQWGRWVQLPVAVAAAGVVYALAFLLVPMFRRDITGVLQIVRKGTGKNR
ncbi:polysaccharide transporter, PST family [Friedmanniella luteola]|uniref:Polysaccharide transporter, PST family n=1 Tax=Friedmanniella luteola TaxID=546871 RepID=A0A1H1LNW3_9ACTN|nr:lipopolysaccharide biosynthesis protein [Friedmanniella luteola]SDR75982.1 polysaccharide transporter, PST family [Friedmanniella luteola]